MPKSSLLKLASLTVAEGGIDAIGDEFRSGRIEYGIVTVQCNVTKQPKVLLIHWVYVFRDSLAFFAIVARRKCRYDTTGNVCVACQ